MNISFRSRGWAPEACPSSKLKIRNRPATAKQEGGQTVNWVNAGGESADVDACGAGEWVQGVRKGWFECARSPPSKRGRTRLSAGLGPRRSKTGRRARSRNSALAAADLSGDGRSSLLEKRGTCRASSVAGSTRRESSLDPGKLAATAHAMAPFSASRAEAGISPGMANCRY